MEKRISYMSFQQVKSVFNTIQLPLRQKAKIQADIDGLDAEFIKKGEDALAKLKQKLKDDKAKKLSELQAQIAEKDNDIATFEAGILNKIGMHVTDLVKKVIEPTGKTDANGKPLTVTKYLPTDIVRYDETSREYVITVPDEQPEAGSDFDNDAASFRADETTDAEINPSEGDEVSEVADEPANEQEPKDEMPWE